MLPVFAYNLLQSIELLALTAENFAKNCIDGIQVNREKAESLLRQTLALATNLVPLVGYDNAAVIAKKAYSEKKTIIEVACEEGIVKKEDIPRIFGVPK